MFKLDEEKPSASVLWPEARAASRRILSGTSTPLLQRDFAYSLNPDGNLICLEAGTGRQIWETDHVTRQKTGRSACMHMTVSGSFVFIYNELGELILARLSPRGYEELCRTTLMQPSYPFGGIKLTWAAPSFANNCV